MIAAAITITPATLHDAPVTRVTCACGWYCDLGDAADPKAIARDHAKNEHSGHVSTLADKREGSVTPINTGGGRVHSMTVEAEAVDMVNHPPHYTQSGIEPADAIEAWGLGFCLGNAVKYIARHEHKGEPLQDLEKARWYLDREIARRRG